MKDIYVENKDSVSATAFIILQKWYQGQKELKVPELKHALCVLQLERFNEEIIDRHFEQRRQFSLHLA